MSKKLFAATALAVLLSACASTAPQGAAKPGYEPNGIDISKTDGYIARAAAIKAGLMPESAETDLYFKVSGQNTALVVYGAGELPDGYSGRKSFAGEVTVDRLEEACGGNIGACFFKEGGE